jgi:hypothetical protein
VVRRGGHHAHEAPFVNWLGSPSSRQHAAWSRARAMSAWETTVRTVGWLKFAT